MLAMFAKSFDTGMKTSTPLSDCGIDDALIEFIPRGHGTFSQSQLTDSFTWCLAHGLSCCSQLLTFSNIS